MCRAIQVTKNNKEEGKNKGRWRRRRKSRSKKKAENKEAEKKPSISKAEELANQLASTEAHVEPFGSCKAVSKRRMQIKRLCHGRVNTITTDAEKVQVIAKELIEALKAEKKRDNEVKGRIQKKDPEVTEEMACGHDYFIYLLSKEVRRRVEAEGFNGPRGDGFPLAAFVSAVAAEVPAFIPTLETFIHASCPLALPVLVGKEESEEKFSESLGMKKDEDGEYESFDRFLQRTEGHISFMANVMSSKPEKHALFGGHEGGIKWLETFLDQLLKEPGQLPLFFAPVLHAFLVGAGNMLANLHAEKFEACLKLIADDAVQRLDEGAIGAPSAHRLKECVEKGMEVFEETLPSKALASLYNNGKEAPLSPPPSLIPGQSLREKFGEFFSDVSLPAYDYMYDVPSYNSSYNSSYSSFSNYSSSFSDYDSFSSSSFSQFDFTPDSPASRPKYVEKPSAPPVSRSRRILAVSTWNKPVSKIDCKG